MTATTGHGATMTAAEVQQALDALPVGYNRAIIRECILAKDAEIASLAAEAHRKERDFLNVESERAALRRAVNEYQPEIARLRAALKPFAKFAEAYAPIASTLDYPEDHVLMAAPPGGTPTVLRLSDLVAALKALEGT